MTLRRGVLAACLGLCAGLGDHAALVQSRVVVDEDNRVPTEPAEWIVDNYELKHGGPGLMWRSTPDLRATMGVDNYVPWNTSVTGVEVENGWVRVNKRYLPMEVKGALVLRRKHGRSKLQISYKPTKVKGPGSTWINCNVTGPGRLPDTYDIVVQPRELADYIVRDVPKSELMNVTRVRAFIPMDLAVRRPMINSTQQQAQSVKLIVKYGGKRHYITLQKKAPLRTMMNMACEKIGVSMAACSRFAHFKFDDRLLNPDDRVDDTDVKDGAVINMYRGPTAPFMAPARYLPTQ